MIWRKSDVINLIKNLLLKNRISGQILAEDVVSVLTGEVIAEAGTKVDKRDWQMRFRMQQFHMYGSSSRKRTEIVKVLSNMMVDLNSCC